MRWWYDDQWGDDHDDIRSVKLGSDRGAAMQGVNKEKKERKWKVGNYLEKEKLRAILTMINWSYWCPDDCQKGDDHDSDWRLRDPWNCFTCSFSFLTTLNSISSIDQTLVYWPQLGTNRLQLIYEIASHRAGVSHFTKWPRSVVFLLWRLKAPSHLRIVGLFGGDRDQGTAT